MRPRIGSKAGPENYQTVDWTGLGPEKRKMTVSKPPLTNTMMLVTDFDANVGDRPENRDN